MMKYCADAKTRAIAVPGARRIGACPWSRPRAVPGAMSRAVTLFHMSDLHFGMEDRAALDWFAAEVADAAPDAVICTGDLTMRARHHEFAEASRWLAALAAPVMVEPGNHDMPYFNPLERFVRPYARYATLRRAVNAEIALGGISVVPLRTVARAQWRLNWSKGRVSPSGLVHALARLGEPDPTGPDETAPDRPRLRLIACHHPLVEAGTDATASTRGGPRALAALARAGVDAVLSGHVHDAFDRVVEAGGLPIRIVGAGTLSERVRRSRPSYNRLDWSAAAGLAVTVREMP